MQGDGACLPSGLKNSGHVGRVGEWAEMAAREGLVSIHFVNVRGSVLVAPFGGVDRTFSTAPFCVGIPRKGEKPVILDFATSLVAEGKVLVASQGGKKIPADALVSQDGSMSGDPHVLYGDYDAGRPARIPQGHRRDPRLRRAQGLGARADVRIARRRAHRQRRLAALASNGRRACSPSTSMPTKIDPEHFFPAEVTRMIGFVKGSKPIDSGRRRAGAGRAGRPLPRRAAEERHSAAGRHLGVTACDRARGRHRRRTRLQKIQLL